MPTDIREAIEALPNAFVPDKARNAKALFQLDLTPGTAGEGTGGDWGGKWVLDISDGQCQVREEVASRPDATVTMDPRDLIALFSNQLDPVKAFMAGKIKVAGNLGLVMQLMNWFQMG
jgi:putative sterol carrier protein